MLFDDVALSIDKLPSNISVLVDNINVGDSAVVNITVSVVSGKVMVSVDNNDYNVSVNNYNGQLLIPDLSAGDYTVIARFLGDDIYSSSFNTTSFAVSKIKLSKHVLSVNDTIFIVSLPSDAIGELIVNVNDKN